MHHPAKVQLSTQEMELVQNTKWILTKHIIMKKVFDMFGNLCELMKSGIEPYAYLFPENIKYQSGKISKGENYQLLPYAILDYPGFFWKDNNIFAVRTMFWWGNFFSVTLHLSGLHKQQFTNDAEKLLCFLQKNNFFICINKDEWQHHFEENNYLPAVKFSLRDFKKINEKHFIKVSKKISVAEWNNAEEFIIKSFWEIINLLEINFPSGKKDL